MVPSSSTAASRSATWARPCVVAIMCSTRVSIHLSGHAVMPRERGQHHVLRIAAELHAEAAAHVGVDHADQVLWHAEHAGEVGAQVVRRLVRGPDDEAAAWSGRARPRTARGSIGTPHSRWLTIRCFTTRLALAKAASGSPDLIWFCARCCSGRRRGAAARRRPSRRRCRSPPGSGSQSTTTAAAPSRRGLVRVGDHGGDRLADVADAVRRQRPVLAPARAARWRRPRPTRSPMGSGCARACGCRRR